MGGEPAAAALLQKERDEGKAKLFDDYTKLLQSKSDLSSLKETVATLETKMGVVKRDIQMLQNQVSGNAFSAPSLLATDAEKVEAHSDGSSLESRTIALEKAVSLARSQVTSIEQVVVGL